MPFALFDWDNTLHDGWTLEGWVVHLIREGVLTREREPEWRALRHRYDTGRIGHNRLAVEANRAYAREVAGWAVDEAVRHAERFVTDSDHHRVFPWAADLLRRLTAAGTKPIIVTGAPTELVHAHLRAMDVTGVDVYALTLAVDGAGRYTGRITRNPGAGTTKRRLVERLGGSVELGAGDSESDLPLLRAARRQLIVGTKAPRLQPEFGATAACIDRPLTITAGEVYDLIT